jgi:hypothetical protein
MLDTILSSVYQGPAFWVLLTLANTFLIARVGCALVDKYDKWKAQSQWKRWEQRYGSEQETPRLMPERELRLEGFARDLKELCTKYGVNLQAECAISVSDRAEGLWRAVFAGCDLRGVYNRANAGWYQ